MDFRNYNCQVGSWYIKIDENNFIHAFTLNVGCPDKYWFSLALGIDNEIPPIEIIISQIHGCGFKDNEFINKLAKNIHKIWEFDKKYVITL